jgi:hypothetical protein
MADTQPEHEEPWAAQRDASWYSRPDVYSDKVIHVAGREDREGFMSRCGRSVLNDGMTWELDEVPAGLRCRSNGCRQAWPAVGPS